MTVTVLRWKTWGTTSWKQSLNFKYGGMHVHAKSLLSDSLQIHGL